MKFVPYTFVVVVVVFSVPGHGKSPPYPFHLRTGRTSKVFLIILFLATAFYVFSCQHFEFTPPLIRPWRNIYKQNLCVDVTQEMRNGKWRPRRDLQPEDEQHRREHDIRIRKLRGLPIKLYRADMRCGKKFALNAPAFGPKFLLCATLTARLLL